MRHALTSFCLWVLYKNKARDVKMALKLYDLSNAYDPRPDNWFQGLNKKYRHPALFIIRLLNRGKDRTLAKRLHDIANNKCSFPENSWE